MSRLVYIRVGAGKCQHLGRISQYETAEGVFGLDGRTACGMRLDNDEMAPWLDKDVHTSFSWDKNPYVMLPKCKVCFLQPKEQGVLLKDATIKEIGEELIRRANP